MLVLSEAISGRKVMSIHSGGAISQLGEPLIDPSSLKIIAFATSTRGQRYFSVLHTSDIREWSGLGVIINSEDDIMEVDENMPKIKDLAEEGFRLDGIGVRTESGKRLGKVVNYVFETEGFFVVKLYIEKVSILGLIKSPISIERDSVINVTKKFIVVADDLNRVKSTEKTGANVEYGFNAN